MVGWEPLLSHNYVDCVQRKAVQRQELLTPKGEEFNEIKCAIIYIIFAYIIHQSLHVIDL